MFCESLNQALGEEEGVVNDLLIIFETSSLVRSDGFGSNRGGASKLLVSPVAGRRKGVTEPTLVGVVANGDIAPMGGGSSLSAVEVAAAALRPVSAVCEAPS